MKAASRVRNPEFVRERFVARLRPDVRERLRKAALEWDVSESRLTEMALEQLLGDGVDEGALKMLLRSVDEVNITLRKLLQANENQAEIIGHFIFQYFTTAPMIRRSEEEAVRLSTRERFIDFLERVSAGVKAGRSIFELGYGGHTPRDDSPPKLEAS